jgi:hypothetical protein
MSTNYLPPSLQFLSPANRWGMLKIYEMLDEERAKTKFSRVPLKKSFSLKTSFSPSLVRGAWNFSLSNRLIVVILNLVLWT